VVIAPAGWPGPVSRTRTPWLLLVEVAAVDVEALFEESE
jgi:hypothetical protein